MRTKSAAATRSIKSAHIRSYSGPYSTAFGRRDTSRIRSFHAVTAANKAVNNKKNTKSCAQWDKVFKNGLTEICGRQHLQYLN